MTQFSGSATAAQLTARFAALDALELLRLAIEQLFAGEIALVSSFGADSAVLLHMIARIEPRTPVLFVETGQLFQETLAYRDHLVLHLGLENVQSIAPDPIEVARTDPNAFLWSTDPDRCCVIRKVDPLNRALASFSAWITGRKRHQAATRARLALFEADGDLIKINPLADWNAARVLSYLREHKLPRHPLVASNYLSIGCMPCTSPVKPGEDPRAGRWRGRGKTECGIHRGELPAGAPA